jgi:iron complex outermembrane receptor protein
MLKSYRRHDDLSSVRTAIAAALLGGMLLAGGWRPAVAQQTATASDSGVGLQEVIVTARKHQENELEVPISVESFSATDLAQAGIYDLQSLKDEAGFTFQQTASTSPGGRDQGSLIFRGLQSTYGDVRENSGSLFVDGVFISGGQASISTVDVDRVEVLKGPQNTYFGRNTFGGAINFITKAPSDDFKVDLTASGTDRGSSDDVLTLQGPIIKGLLDGRITLNSHIKGAEYRASDGGDLGAEQTEAVDGSLSFTPDNGLKLRFNAHYQEDDDSAAAMGYLAGQAAYGNTCGGKTFHGYSSLPNGGQGAPVAVTLSQEYFCGSIPTISQLSALGYRVVDANTALQPAYLPIQINNSLGNVFQGDVPRLDHQGLRRNLFRFSVIGEYALPFNATASFNAGYDTSATNVVWDVDRTSSLSFTSSLPELQNDLTIDARVASDQTRPLRGLVGVSYFSDLLQYEEDSLYGPGLVGSAFAFLNGFSGLSSFVDQRSWVPAVYASLEYDILSNLTATAEVRYQSDKDTDFLTLGSSYVPGTPPRASDTNNTPMPRFILRYKPITGTMLYVSYAEGVQPTSLQSGWLSLTPTQKAYVAGYGVSSAYSLQPKIEMVEAGIKQSLFENRFDYSLDAYHGLWEHQQTESALFGGPLPPGGTYLDLSNAATVEGFELSTKARVTEKLTASFNVQYVHAIWDSYNNATLAGFTTQDISWFSGNYLSRVPAWTGNFNVTYNDHLINGWDWYARADVNYTGSMWESDINIVKTDPYARVNALFGIKKDDYSIELFAKNLFNDQHWDFAERVPNLQQPNITFTNEGLLVQAPDKQEIGVRVKVKFD